MKFLKISLILVFFSTFFHCKMVFAEVASNFSLFTLEGEPVELYPIVSKGNIVVISFFTTWCKPCKKEFPILNKLAKKFSGKPVKIFLIRSDFVSET
ncbi:MAG: TlpA family protein disulfide reductase, partial [Endomicrobia bacterium]|nr:TlpA family protein disulfide reductase [Endomicrobiia bacterium]